MATDAQPLSGTSESYLELVRECPLRPIRTEAELARAVAMIDRLTDKSDRTADEEDDRDVLADLVHAHELATEPEPEGEDSPAEMLMSLMEANGLTPARLAADTGIPEETIAEVLAGNGEATSLTTTALGRHFAVHPSLFLPTERPSRDGRKPDDRPTSRPA